MTWEQLLSLQRFGDTTKRIRKEQDELRLGFEVDYDRIVFSSSFRSLQDKTQVIPFSKTDFVHTRLTHSLEVSVVARSLGRLAGKALLDKHPHLSTVHGYQANDFGAIVAAAAGANVAKHGNRSISSKSGSADLLEAAKVRLDLSPQQVVRCVQEQGVGFMFAPAHHGAMKYAIGPRRELATRTIFNLLGPLTNPAAAPNQVLGVFSRGWVRPLAEVLKNLGSHHVMLVHSADGLDEISLAEKTYVAELKQGEIIEYEISPQDFGISNQSLASLSVETSEDSLTLINDAFANSNYPAADMIALNAGAAIYVSGIAGSMQEGVDLARDIIGSGQAKTKFASFAEFTRVLKEVE